MIKSNKLQTNNEVSSPNLTYAASILGANAYIITILIPSMASKAYWLMLAKSSTAISKSKLLKSLLYWAITIVVDTRVTARKNEPITLIYREYTVRLTASDAILIMKMGMSSKINWKMRVNRTAPIFANSSNSMRAAENVMRATGNESTAASCLAKYSRGWTWIK